MKLSDAQHSLLQRGWLAQVEPRVSIAVMAAVRIVLLSEGQALFHPKDEPGGIYGVAAGGILLSVVGLDGLPVPGHIMRSGGWFGYGSVALRQNRILMAQANEASVVVQLPLMAIETLRARLPDASRAFGQLSAHGEAALLNTVSDLLVRDTDRRLAAVLLRVTGALDATLDRDPRGVPLAQALLAEMANTSSHTVARFVTFAEGQGWIEWRYRRVRIVRPDLLERFAAKGLA